MNIARLPEALRIASDTFQVFDDFHWYISPHLWTSLAADAGTSVAITAGAAGGVLALTTGATDNNEAAAFTTTSLFVPAANKPLYCEGLVQWAEANVSAANVFFGLASSPGANLLVDDGAGPRTTGTVIGLYKVDGGTVWRCVTRNGTAVADSVSTATAGGAVAQRLSIEIIDETPTKATVVFRVDGQLLRDATTNLPIKHDLTLASIAAAALVADVTAGSANSEVLSVDYGGCVQAR